MRKPRISFRLALLTASSVVTFGLGAQLAYGAWPLSPGYVQCRTEDPGEGHQMCDDMCAAGGQGGGYCQRDMNQCMCFAPPPCTSYPCPS